MATNKAVSINKDVYLIFDLDYDERIYIYDEELDDDVCEWSTEAAALAALRANDDLRDGNTYAIVKQLRKYKAAQPAPLLKEIK